MLQVSVHEYQRRPALSQIFSIQESMELAKKSQESHLHSGVIKPGKLLFDRGDFSHQLKVKEPFSPETPL